MPSTPASSTPLAETPPIPILLSAGEHGRVLLYGRVHERPVAGVPVTLYGARMIIRWSGTEGALGLAAHGPRAGSRLSPSVPETTETRWQEWTLCTAEAAEALEAYRE